MPPFKINLERRERKGFRASDYGKLALDIYFDFIGEPYTDPVDWNETLKWGAGKGVELQMVKVLQDTEIVPKGWSQAEEDTYEMERNGLKIRMKIDAINMAGEPIEIKSINNKNAIDKANYAANKPRENYVGQLAVYMDYLGQERGYLFVAAVDGLDYFWIECKKIGDGIYQCGETAVDLNKEYARWASIDKCLKEGKLPDIYEYGRYKIPLDKIDWEALMATTQGVKSIERARSGEKVIGDPEAWRILYSPWKKKIIELQGSTEGYSDDEKKLIKEKTENYKSKTKSDGRKATKSKKSGEGAA